MKTNKLLFLLVCLLCAAYSCLAQDIVTKKTGEDVVAKVLEITPSEIKFKLHENLEGPTYTMAKADVLKIVFENGRVEVYGVEDVMPAIGNSEGFYAKGQMDAANYYKGYKGASTGTLVSSLVSPLLGLVPAIICSSSKPEEHNLDYPSHELMKEDDYRAGYTQRSKKIKSRKVWTNWGIGLGVNIVVIALFAN